jgi:hypothetical protein
MTTPYSEPGEHRWSRAQTDPTAQPTPAGGHPNGCPGPDGGCPQCVADQPNPADVRQRLALVTGEPHHLVDIADALLLLLPPTPTEDRHTVNDVSPDYDGDPRCSAGWAYGSWTFGIRFDPDRPSADAAVKVSPGLGQTWYLPVQEVEDLAAILLSAAARARAQQEATRG